MPARGQAGGLHDLEQRQSRIHGGSDNVLDVNGGTRPGLIEMVVAFPIITIASSLFEEIGTVP